MSQADLAAAASVSRQWLSALERGKRTAELGLVLRVIDVAGLILTATDQQDTLRSSPNLLSQSDERAHPDRVRVDLDDLDNSR